MEPNMSLWNYWLFWTLSTILALFIGGFLKSYMSKKGENLATKEDIRELTRVQREIEAKISGELWQKQKQFEMKKDAIVAAMSEFPSAENYLLMMYSQLKLGKQTEQDKIEMLREYYKVFGAFERAVWTAELVSGDDVRAMLFAYKSLFVEMGTLVIRGDFELYENKRSDLVRMQTALYNAVRKELMVDQRPA
jgi:hypothetical protein